MTIFSNDIFNQYNETKDIDTLKEHVLDRIENEKNYEKHYDFVIELFEFIKTLDKQGKTKEVNELIEFITAKDTTFKKLFEKWTLRAKNQSSAAAEMLSSLIFKENGLNKANTYIIREQLKNVLDKEEYQYFVLAMMTVFKQSLISSHSVDAFSDNLTYLSMVKNLFDGLLYTALEENGSFTARRFVEENTIWKKVQIISDGKKEIVSIQGFDTGVYKNEATLSFTCRDEDGIDFIIDHSEVDFFFEK